jgi:hypothetical protein
MLKKKIPEDRRCALHFDTQHFLKTVLTVCVKTGREKFAKKKKSARLKCKINKIIVIISIEIKKIMNITKWSSSYVMSCLCEYKKII